MFQENKMRHSLFTKIIVLSLVIIAIFTIFYIYDSGKNVENYVIELTPEGFKPESLVVEKGTVVTFVNFKGGPSWPASDPHPAHTNYSKFDPMRALAVGESWSLAFNDVGVWSFHDHLSPYFIGKITVTEAKSKNMKSALVCNVNPHTKECWAETLTTLLDTKDLSAVLSKVSDYYKEEPLFSNSCHDMMHDIGHKAYKNYLEDKDSVINPKAFYCANGFYHGFMASFLLANPDLKKAKEFCRFVGDELKEKAPDAKLQCYHGIGHGLLEEGFQSGLSSFSEQDMIDPAMLRCEEVSDTGEELYRCVSGVFNGIANFYISGQYDLEVNRENPIMICENQKDKYKESCYGNFNSVLMYISNNNFSNASKYVVGMKDVGYREMSMRYLSGLATLFVAKGDPEEAIDSCRKTGNLNRACLEGFARGFLEHGEPDNEWKEAISFCENQSMTQPESQNCLRFVISSLSGWYPMEKVSNICSNIKVEYKQYCQNL